MKRRFYKTIVACLLLVTMLFATGCDIPFFTPTTKIENKTQLYDNIVSCMERNITEFTFIYTGEDADTVLDMNTILNSISGLKSIEYEMVSSVSGDKVTLNMSYWDSDAIIYAYRNANASYLTDRQKTMYDKYIAIMNLCTSKSNSAYENEKSVYNYLVDNITYDKKIESHFNAYEALTEGRAVCAGYSEVFRTLMELLGYECITVSGTADNENHMWNAIKLGNEWYQVDVTWGDTDEDSLNPVRVYAYFNINEPEMALDHTRTSVLPDSYKEGIRYTYASYESVPVIYSQKDLNTLVSTALKSKQPTVEFIAKTDINAKSSFTLANVSCSYTMSTIEKEGMYYYSINCTYY
ncbi:MAG: hypothetical protein IJB96_06610 [Lachnospira sp.]|nr:hypothetical protein [Lachnospira sp.]